ncbi:MAG: fatty acid desaturase [Gammaproteobacteria bacterium]|nr:fatty acid desaturase [Gammaproteobacteria bacterium]
MISQAAAYPLSDFESEVLIPKQTNKPDLNSLKKQVAAYRGSDLKTSRRQLLTNSLSLVLFFSLGVFAYQYYLSLVIVSIIGSAFCLLRLFMIQHDCGHGAYFQNRKTNDWVGRIIGVVTLTPYHCWRRYHALHHASTGNLDKRGFGDIKTLTLNEYQHLSIAQKLFYRLYRNPILLFVLAPSFLFFIRQRLTYYIPKDWVRERRSVHGSNISIMFMFFLMSALVGAEIFLALYIPAMMLAASVGVWLFYVQHQFEDAYWAAHDQWDYSTAAVTGSSYYALPAWMQWLVAHITVHHVHHLDCTIPNYRLKACNENIPGLMHAAPNIGFWQSLACVRYKLWDEKTKQMISFKINKF